MLLFMVVIAFAIAWLRNLFTVVMLTGIFSLLAATLYVLLTAVDVAFTEAAVGAGISTILLLATIALTTEVEKRPERKSLAPLLIVSVTGAALIFGTFDMPRYGDANAPANKHVAPRYVQKSGEEIGLPNIVTSILASYRGYDTLGETVVIFTAAIGVLVLLGKGRGPERWRPGMRPKARPEEEDEV